MPTQPVVLDYAPPPNRPLRRWCVELVRATYRSRIARACALLAVLFVGYCLVVVYVIDADDQLVARTMRTTLTVTAQQFNGEWRFVGLVGTPAAQRWILGEDDLHFHTLSPWYGPERLDLTCQVDADLHPRMLLVRAQTSGNYDRHWEQRRKWSFSAHGRAVWAIDRQGQLQLTNNSSFDLPENRVRLMPSIRVEDVDGVRLFLIDLHTSWEMRRWP